MALIYFESDDLEVEADEGISFLEIAAEADCDITFGCRSGTCGTCRVRVIEGKENLTPPQREEREFLEGFGAHPDERLACQARVLGDCRIKYVGLDDLEE